MATRKSTPYRVWTTLRTRKPGGTFSKQSLLDNLPNATLSAVSNALHRMRKAGVIKPAEQRGRWIVLDGIAEYGNTHQFITNYPQNRKSPRSPVRPQEPRTPVEGGSGVIENLLSALSEAEAEIRRLQAVDADVKALAARFTERSR